MSEQPQQGRPVSPVQRFAFTLMVWLLMIMGLQFVMGSCFERQQFQNEFGFARGDEGHSLAIASRLQALCTEYEAAVARAEEFKQSVIPGTIPGSEAERLQFIKDAQEKLTEERAEFARMHFIMSRRLAESVGPLPEISGCQELISSDAE